MSSFHDIEKYKIQPELKLILLLLRIDNGDHVTGEINSLSGSNFDWNRFLFYVRWHRLGNFVHSALEKYPDPVPPEIAERLKNETEKGKFRIMKLSQELVLLTKIFQQKEIDIISVKGPLLSKRIFGDMCMRPSRDLDLLIPPDEIETAGKILESAGYRMINPKHKPSGRFMDYFVKHYSDFEYLHPEHNIIVELHWKLFNNSYLYPSGFSDLSGRAITDRFGGTEIKVLSDEDALLHLFLHGTWHNWMRLFWLYDIVGIVSGGLPVDWDGFVNRAKRSGTARSVAGGLELAAVLFGTDVPESAHKIFMQDVKVKLLINNSLRSVAYANPDTLLTKKGRWFISTIINMRKNLRYKARYILSLCTSHKDWAVLPLPGRLFFLYYPLRPFLWAIRYLFRRNYT